MDPMQEETIISKCTIQPQQKRGKNNQKQRIYFQLCTVSVQIAQPPCSLGKPNEKEQDKSFNW